MSIFSTNPLPNLFGGNPFAALQRHMGAVVETVAHVPELVEALIQEDQARVVKIKDAAFEAEAEADRLTVEFRNNLPRGLFLPVDRRDLLDIIEFQDAIADVAQDVAGMMVERKMRVPKGLAETLTEYVDKVVDTCTVLNEAIQMLDELLATGFSGRKAEAVAELLTRVNELEDESDELGTKMTRLLFAMEDEMSPVSVVFWFKLIRWIGDIADNAEHVANRLRITVAH